MLALGLFNLPVSVAPWLLDLLGIGTTDPSAKLASTTIGVANTVLVLGEVLEGNRLFMLGERPSLLLGDWFMDFDEFTFSAHHQAASLLAMQHKVSIGSL